MVVCQFYLAGNCKFGDRCFNEHPRGGGHAGGGGGRGVTFRDSFGTAGNQPASNPYKWTAAGGAGPQQQQQQASNISVQDIVKSLPKEMEVWQTSKMWPFSCFSMEKELPSLPEFMDLSPEELRLEAYNAIQQGTVEAFRQKVAQLAQEFRQKQDQIRAMPDPLRQKLTHILEEGRRQKAARTSGQPVVRPSTFGGGQAGGNVFGSGTSGVFGGGAVGGSVFGGASHGSGMSGSTFGGGALSSPSTSSVFGNTGNTSSMSASPFGGMGGSATQSVFGQPSSSAAGSVFGGSQTIPASTTPSIFGQGVPAPGLFGGSTPSTLASSSGGSVFGSGGGGGLFAQPGGSGVGPAPGLFGKGASSAVGGAGFGQPASTGAMLGQKAGSVFGQNAGGGGAGLFGKPPASSSPSVFGQAVTATAPAPGLFGGSAAQSTVFGGSVAANSATPQPGLFGAASSGAVGSGFRGGSTFGGAAAAASPPYPESGSLYTPLAQLTESEKAQFEAKAFTPGMIPMRPPPKELINV